MITLTSQDNKEFKVEKKVAERSVLLKNLLEDVGESDTPIPLPNVTGKTLQKVLEYCNYHKDDPLAVAEEDKGGWINPDLFDTNRKRPEDTDPWDANFIKVDNDDLFELILAANYMDIKPLLDLGCKTVAGMLKGKSPEDIRQMFNIENDFTPEEEEQIRRYFV